MTEPQLLRRRFRATCSLGWYLVDVAVVASVIYPWLADRYVEQQAAQLKERYERLVSRYKNVASHITKAFQRETGLKTIPLVPPPVQGMFPSINPLAAIERVAIWEDRVRVFNRAVEETSEEEWASQDPNELDGPSRVEIASLKLSRGAASMLFATEQLVCVIVAFAMILALIPCLQRASREIEFAQKFVAQLESGGNVDIDTLAQTPERSAAVDLMVTAVQKNPAQAHASADAAGERALTYLEKHERLTLAAYAVWFLPTVGFVGTLRGLAGALSVSDSPKNLSATIAYLQIAFDSSLVALLLAAPIVLLQHLFAIRIDRLQQQLVVALNVMPSTALTCSPLKPVMSPAWQLRVWNWLAGFPSAMRAAAQWVHWMVSPLRAIGRAACNAMSVAVDLMTSIFMRACSRFFKLERQWRSKVAGWIDPEPRPSKPEVHEANPDSDGTSIPINAPATPLFNAPDSGATAC